MAKIEALKMLPRWSVVCDRPKFKALKICYHVGVWFEIEQNSSILLMLPRWSVVCVGPKFKFFFSFNATTLECGMRQTKIIA